MATLGSPDSPTSPRRRKSCVRKWERYCCSVIQYIPLGLVYGLTSWAVWVEVNMGLLPGWKWPTLGRGLAALGVIIYGLLNWSYTTAVFTDPGSTIENKPGYSALPTSETRPYTSFTVKSTGDIRFCKKCHAKKPDRAHHCSTCGRCVLKMDHHCPWLATCVGLRNYKAFLLFLAYTSVFCWVCFAVSALWIWREIIVIGAVEESLMPINYILLAVLSGVIGLVITGLTGWHIYLICRGITTIESLEKTRYLSPLRQQISAHLNPQRTYVDDENHTITEQLRDLGDTLTEIHANALPGIFRPEEGEERLSPSPAQSSLHSNLYNDYEFQERQRDRDRYNEYLDELDSERLPNAFDLGWRRNIAAILGPSPLLWWLPICNSAGDGWNWEPSQKWLEARERIKVQREEGLRHQRESEREAGYGVSSQVSSDSSRASNGKEQALQGPSPRRLSPGSSKADRVLGRTPHQYADGASWDSESKRKSTPLQSLQARPSRDDADDYDDSSDEEMAGGTARLLKPGNGGATGNWNDLPDDFVDLESSKRVGRSGGKSR